MHLLDDRRRIIYINGAGCFCCGEVVKNLTKMAVNESSSNF